MRMPARTTKPPANCSTVAASSRMSQPSRMARNGYTSSDTEVKGAGNRDMASAIRA
jgi:hypothetical protein